MEQDYARCYMPTSGTQLLRSKVNKRVGKKDPMLTAQLDHLDLMQPRATEGPEIEIQECLCTLFIPLPALSSVG